MNDVGHIARQLDARIEELCRLILPGGKLEAGEWHIGDITGAAGRSLKVCLRGRKQGVFKDFAGEIGGDALDLLRHVKFGGDKGEAVRWARDWLGLPAGARAQRQAPEPDRERHSREIDADAMKRTNSARNIFLHAEPRLAGTPADLYLKARGIDLAWLGKQPRALRFAPLLYNAESGRDLPALVAALNNAAGELTAVHRIWLERDQAGVWRKAPLRTQKSSIGRVAGSAIRLWRGASKKPLKDAPAGDVLVLTEGLETGLAVALAAPEYRVMAVTGVSNFKNIELPPAITTVIVAGDNDALGGPAEAALYAAAAALQRPGRVVRIARSPAGSDFNDCLIG